MTTHCLMGSAFVDGIGTNIGFHDKIEIELAAEELRLNCISL